MATPRTDILFPVGRLVMGSLYKPRDKDADGNPLLIKNGPDAGKPRTDYFIAVAITKEPGHTHWAQTEWGAKILACGAAAFPQSYQSPAFAFKVEDGSSAVPNTKGKKPCDHEGWPGNWIVKLSGGYAPRICSADGSQTLTEPDVVKNGHFVQVFGNVGGNGSSQRPGVYLNHNAVAHAGYGPEIRSGLDTAAVGFGGALPAGASAVPIGAMQAPAVAAPALPGLPGAPVMVQAAPAFLAPAMPSTPALPALPGMPAPPAALPTAPAAPMMTPAGLASGYTYAQYVQAGYSDLQMRQQGLIV